MDYNLGELAAYGTREGYISFRILTDLEKEADDIILTKRDYENSIQIGRQVRRNWLQGLMVTIIHVKNGWKRSNF